MLRIPTLVAAILIAALLLVQPRRALAEEDFGAALGLAYWGLASDVAVGAAQVATIIGNAVALGRHRPARGWMIANYVLGTLNAGLAIAWGTYWYEESPRDNLALGASIAHGAVAAAGLGLAIATHARGRVRDLRVSTLGPGLNGISVAGRF